MAGRCFYSLNIRRACRVAGGSLFSVKHFIPDFFSVINEKQKYVTKAVCCKYLRDQFPPDSPVFWNRAWGLNTGLLLRLCIHSFACIMLIRYGNELIMRSNESKYVWDVCACYHFLCAPSKLWPSDFFNPFSAAAEIHIKTSKKKKLTPYYTSNFLCIRTQRVLKWGSWAELNNKTSYITLCHYLFNKN